VVEQRRRERGSTQAELAERVGVSRQWVNALEAAEGNPTFTNLLAVLASLDLSLDIVEMTSAQRPAIVHPDLDGLVNRHRLPLSQPRNP
jgi:transcriptional regulator with XRE-family HTH domain